MQQMTIEHQCVADRELDWNRVVLGEREAERFGCRVEARVVLGAGRVQHAAAVRSGKDPETAVVHRRVVECDPHCRERSIGTDG